MVTGTMSWSGGTIAGPLTVATNGVLNIVGGTETLQSPLTNAGTVTLSGTGSLIVRGNNSTTFGALYNVAGALWNIQSDRGIACYYCNNSYESFNNAGTVRKTAGTGTNLINVGFNNGGTLGVESGAIQFGGALSQTGGGILDLGLDATNSNGHVSFSSPLAMGGTLSAHTNGTYSPSVGDTFTLLGYPSQPGSFGSTNLPAQAQWRLAVGTTALTITATNLVTGP
jgi:hypothetical protein